MSEISEINSEAEIKDRVHYQYLLSETQTNLFVSKLWFKINYCNFCKISSKMYSHADNSQADR